MILIYKSCIFCDAIFDPSIPHICKETNNTKKIDIDETVNTNDKTDDKPDHPIYNNFCNNTNSPCNTQPNNQSNNQPYNPHNTPLQYHSINMNENKARKEVFSPPPLYNCNDEMEYYLPENNHPTPPSKTKGGNKKKKTYNTIPTQLELYELVMQLSKKCETLQTEVTNLKTKFSTRLKRDIADYLQYDQRPTYTFLEWVNSFVVTDEILELVFETNLMDGIKKCIEDRIKEEGIYCIPIRVFKEKPDHIFIYTNEPMVAVADDKEEERGGGGEEPIKIKCVPVELRLGVKPNELLKTPTWRMVPKSSFIRVKEYVAEHVLKKFYLWENENEPKMIHSAEKMDLLTSYTLKVIGHGTKSKKEAQIAELYKWFFGKMAIS